MPVVSAETVSELLRQTLERYDESLLRRVAGRLLKPRNQWPIVELIERMQAAVVNVPLIDRRLLDLDTGGRRVLAAIGFSRQQRWRLGNLVELGIALGEPDGLKPIFSLFESGFLYPLATGKIRHFEEWIGQPASGLWVFAPPGMAARARGEDLGLEDGPRGVRASGPPHEADGLEWLLRLAVLWQQTAGAPLRCTQQGDFFKRDAERLDQDAMLNAPAPEGLAEVPHSARLAVALAEAEGILDPINGELRTADLPACWENGLLAALESIWADLPLITTWDACQGWRSSESIGNPFPSAYLLAFLLLARLSENEWARPEEIGEWITEHHPYWKSDDLRPSRRQPWVGSFLLGLAHQLRFVQAAKDADGEWLVRLSPLGRWLMGMGGAPTLDTSFQQSLLVQPNLEIIAYRQGLTPALIAKLTKFAQWKSLGAACILQLEPHSIYRALESGLTFASVLQCLEQYSTRLTPPAVIDSLRTWADKRDRLTVYPAAALLEFGSAEELNEALARGVPAIRLSDRLAVIADESAIDYRHFRLIGTRDYSLPPERCVEVAEDGVTLGVDLARSDLLLETELPRFAERLERPGLNGRREYRLTPRSLSAGKSAGLTIAALETWFQQRTGDSLSPAARLLLTGTEHSAPELRRHLVLHVASSDVADGLMQWPETRTLIESRMGPTALAVSEENAVKLRELLAALGIALAKQNSSLQC
jgi:XPB/Ssl2-like helicase family protein